MARIVLLRHAHSVANEKNLLAGRTAGIALSKTGKEQAKDLINRLGNIQFDEVAISPLQRCRETIDPWLDTTGAKSRIFVDDSISEVDYGSWSGKKLAVLSKNKLWRTVQDSPSRMYFPKGEGIAQMQSRAMKSVHEAVESKSKGAAVIVSHGDVIKSIVASALGIHLDEFQRIVIDPASVSILDYSSTKPRVLLLNDTRAIVTDLLVAPKRSKNLLGGGSGK